MKNMSSMAVVALLVSLMINLFPVAVLGQVHFKQLSYPTLNELKIPTVDRLVLPNGLVLFLLEDHELPMINLEGLVRFNVADEPAEKIGLRGIVTSVMRTGGTAKRSGDQIDAELDRLAAGLSVSAGSSYGSFGLFSLKEQWDQSFEILIDILRNPAFPQEKIELKKIESRSSISRRNDEPRSIAIREFIKQLYGPTSVYARHAEYATINAITRDDLVAFHKTHFHPDRMMVAIWGDFDKAAMRKRIEETFGSWPKGTQPPSPVSPAVEFAAKKANLIEKDDVNQSIILMGHLGTTMSNPDYFALEIMNSILGGGFSSRLFKRVRSDQGLAYDASGYFGAGMDHDGIFYLNCSTKSANTVKAIKSLLHEIDELRTSEVTDEEMAVAKDSFLNSFIFNFDSTGEVISRLMELEFFNYPPDFLEITKKNIEKVTKADVLRVAKKYLVPERMRFVVLGKPSEFDGKLDAFGAVNQLDITIPGSPDAGKDTPKVGK